MAALVKHIDVSVVAELLRGSDKANIRVVDVRDYDFNDNGHIVGALNLTQEFFGVQENIDGLIRAFHDQGVKRVVFHCWLSQQRGPWCAARFAERLQDVGSGEIDYVNVMKNGYKKFSAIYLNDADLVDLSSIAQQ
mmetsp:Transcript_634/g.1580  ORF Transcript_634/g.1580 Transcript_634/m.1580 type:complete len:136 (-) Transcript_634:1095-1502(-)